MRKGRLLRPIISFFPAKEAGLSSSLFFPPTLPSNEEERQALLIASGALGLNDNPVLVALVRRTAELLGTSMAALTILDDARQWLPATFGIDDEETPREHAICGFTLLEGKLFCVPDLTKDPRLSNHPLVVGDPYLRYYAGVPVVIGNGAVIGALCGFDTVTHPMVDEGRAVVLRQLADDAAAEINRPEHAVAYAPRAADRLADLIRGAARRDDAEAIDLLDRILRRVERRVPRAEPVPCDLSEWTAMRAR